MCLLTPEEGSRSSLCLQSCSQLGHWQVLAWAGLIGQSLRLLQQYFGVERVVWKGPHGQGSP